MTGNFSVEEDRISNLPEQLIDLVLEGLPVEDVVRTSILSKEWRYRWTTLRTLIFDKHFFKKYAKNGAFGRNGFIRIINKVLILHTGPILKFLLHIPKMFLDGYEEVDEWMSLLSRNGVRELILTNLSERYKLPSYVFSCQELTKLSLENCFFRPPLEFEGFINLKDLELKNIDFRANLFGTRINLPQLISLSLDTCTTVFNFSIKATKLQCLVVYDCPDIMLLRLLHSPCLNMFCISFRKLIEDNVRVERMTLDMMLSNLPKIESLSFDRLFFKVFIAELIPKCLPHAVNNLWHLELLDFQLDDLDQLHGVLCLLRNSPNLEYLYIYSSEKKPEVDVGPASNHLESPDCLDCTLNQLLSVFITFVEGSRTELLFIKLLLAHSPSLEYLSIRPSRTCDAQKRFDIAMDVMRFRRASPKAEVVYLK